MFKNSVRSYGLLWFALFFCVDLAAESQLPDVSNLRVTDPSATVSRRVLSGTVEVIVSLEDPPLAAAVGENARRTGFQLSAAQQRAYAADLNQKQENLMRTISALGGRELARFTKAHNAVAVSVNASQLGAIAALPNVSAVRLVKNYEMVLDSTVPYIGASELHTLGLDGTGIKVAVLDSGIDYTHANLSGPGTAPAYTAAYGASPSAPENTTRDGLFPTAKVVEGYDFVGEGWPVTGLAPDPDPIDFEGHGTHVADIIAGKSTDGTHKGVAPGATLLAVKVCSAVSTSCSGIALLQGMDFALDPNGDADLSDAADVINMSLGSPYGQREDDLSLASRNASRFGVVVVVAAGNSGDRPYIVSSPSTTPEVISVAQTQVPTALAFPLIINSPAGIAGSYPNTATVDWAPVGSGFNGSVAFVGRGCPAGSIDGMNPDDPYLSDPAGKVALIDRGSCAISLKVDRAAQAGAIGVLIGLVAAGDAVSFSFGGGTTFVPTLVITQSTSNLIKANIGAPVVVTLSPSVTLPLVGSMVGSSARGPGYSYNSIKPDIGAPGASVSAVAGSGTGQAAFGGTSGASPMIAGSAALLLQQFPTLSPAQIKARLMNSAEKSILLNPATQPGVLAPITRIGAGEVRVNTAGSLKTAAWDLGDQGAISLGFGHYRTFGMTTYQKRVVIRNYDNVPRTYNISTDFRYPADMTGAVTLNAPSTVNVHRNGISTFVLTLTVDASLLPVWNINGGPNGGNGALLTGLEFDGHITISDATDTVRLPWHILPHKAADVRPGAFSVPLNGSDSAPLTLTNTAGAVAGRLDVFSLTGTSPRIPRRDLPRPGENFAVVDLKSVGVRPAVSGTTPLVQFAINTWGERSHPNYPAEFDVFVDTNRDGTDDYVIFNLENAGFGATGQNVVAVFNLSTNTGIVRFFSDADLDSANVILTAQLSDMGMTSTSQFNFKVAAYDNYFTGLLTDETGTMTYQLNIPNYTASGVPASVPAGGSSVITVNKVPGGDTASPSQTGLLLMYRDARSEVEADAIIVTP